MAVPKRSDPTARHVDATGRFFGAVTVALVLALALGANTLAWAHRSQDHAEIPRLWPGPDGKPLPFRTYNEATEFLRTARIVSSENVGIGIAGIKRLMLEHDGIRARGAFHAINNVTSDSRVGGRMFRSYYDSYKNQCAAYVLARLFELDNVPPTVCRRVNGIEGSVQLWMEETRSETDRNEAGLRPPVISDWLRQVQAMRLFDSLIFNDDRNPGNYLFDADWKLWMIDHSRAFQMRRELKYSDEFVWCSRRTWQLLNQVTDAQIRAAIDTYLAPTQMGALVERRGRLVEHIQKLIDERGEDTVIR